MKKLVLLIIAVIVGTFTANAQIGGFLEKAAKKAQQKTEDKIIEKTSEKAADKVSDAIVDQIPDVEVEEQAVEESDEPLTYEGIMRQLKPIPSVQQMVSYKKAELSGQGLKMLSSEVMKFQMKVLDLTGKVLEVPYQNADSAQIMEAAYNYAEMTTGLSKEEMDMLAQMSEEEQEAYLQAHYNEGQAEAAMMEAAVEASKYLEPLQPTIDRWTAIGDKVDNVFQESDEQCAAIYKKYAAKLDTEDEEARNKVLLKYYEEVAPIIRDAVDRAGEIRFKEQLPIAMEIEEEMVKIRAEHQDAISVLLNYPQLTASAYLAESLKIIEIPEYPEE
ncbi:MAG: hypothetical protein J6T53_05980 [Bacteroidales bacterium]|nr:hypothetical protein [Bacteroidales bacterium]